MNIILLRHLVPVVLELDFYERGKVDRIFLRVKDQYGVLGRETNEVKHLGRVKRGS